MEGTMAKFHPHSSGDSSALNSYLTLLALAQEELEEWRGMKDKWTKQSSSEEARYYTSSPVDLQIIEWGWSLVGSG